MQVYLGRATKIIAALVRLLIRFCSWAHQQVFHAQSFCIAVLWDAKDPASPDRGVGTQDLLSSEDGGRLEDQSDFY